MVRNRGGFSRKRGSFGCWKLTDVEKDDGRWRGGVGHGSEWPKADCYCWMWPRTGARHAQEMVEAWPPCDNEGTQHEGQTSNKHGNEKGKVGTLVDGGSPTMEKELWHEEEGRWGRRASRHRGRHSEDAMQARWSRNRVCVVTASHDHDMKERRGAGLSKQEAWSRWSLLARMMVGHGEGQHRRGHDAPGSSSNEVEVIIGV